jgi:hypothetical protein
MAKRKDANVISSDSVLKYDMLNPLLHSLYTEMKELSAKKQDIILNKVKVTMINRILRQIKELLKEQPTIEFIDLLDEEMLPSNSDAVLVLSQYRSAMHQFYERYYRRNPGDMSSRWHTDDNP